MEDLFTITINDDADALIECRGELDICAAPELQAALQQGGQRRGTEVRINLAGVRYIDSACIKELLAAKNDLNKRGVSFRLIATSTAVLRALHLLSLEHYFGLSERELQGCER